MNAKCPFSAPLVTGRFGCRYAEEVIRRGGSEYDCRSAAHHRGCEQVFAGLKRTGLDAFGAEDDLTTTPHSVLVKIQTGGLLGLARLLGELNGQIEDISALIARATERFGGGERVAFAQVAGDMTGCKLERRGRRVGR